MAQKNMKRLAINYMQIKSTTDSTSHLLEWLNKQTKHLMIPRTAEDTEKLELSFIAGRNTKYQILQQLLIELNIHSPYDPAIVLLGITQKK